MVVELRHLKGTEIEPVALFTDTGEPLFTQSTSVPGKYGVIVLNPDGSNVAGGGGVTAHSALTGLSADDHPQYVLVDGSRAMTGRLTAPSATLTANGAASTPTLLLSGTPFAGTGTTSFPLLYLNDSTATASTTLSTAGTYLGVNGHGSGDLLNLMLDGVSKFKVSTTAITATVPLTGSANGAASTPALLLSGTPFTGGTTTTTKPLLLLEPTGTTSASIWSTAGTMLGINAPSGFTGNLIGLFNNGSFVMTVDSSCVITGAGGTPKLSLNGSVGVKLEYSTNSLAVTSGGTGITGLLTVGSGTTSQITFGGSSSLVLDAANVLALRNGVNAQTLRVYNTYTDASNYERGIFSWSGNTLLIGSESAGTGSGRSVVIQGNSVYVGTSGSARWLWDTSGHLLAQSNLNIWNGTSALATNATAGFLGVNSSAGIPTGVPASVPTGQVPFEIDTTNGRAYFYYGAAWHYAALT